MSALAILVRSFGKQVWGSDITKNEMTERLRRRGIKVYIGHKKRNINGCDLVVFSGAISPETPELIEARKRNIKVIERSQLLRFVSDEYETVIAVSGTHGKTTTTAMIAHIFCLAGLNPTVHLGGLFDDFGGNVRLGDKKFFITEACEFRDSFLTLSPNICVITNFEEEHLDYFKTYENEKKSFLQFAHSAKDLCFVARCCRKELDCNERIVCVGDNRSYHAENLQQNADKRYSFSVFFGKTKIDDFSLNVYGKYNVENALMAVCVALHFKIDKEIIKNALLTYQNVHRRFENVGSFADSEVLIDYAHHPTEIERSIETCHEVFDKNIVCIFQPHTFSRTKILIDKFSTCFSGVDKLFLVKTYSAREKFEQDGSANFLKEKIKERLPSLDVRGEFSKRKVLKVLKKCKFSNCVFLFLGAGDIELCARKLCKKRKG